MNSILLSNRNSELRIKFDRTLPPCLTFGVWIYRDIKILIDPHSDITSRNNDITIYNFLYNLIYHGITFFDNHMNICATTTRMHAQPHIQSHARSHTHFRSLACALVPPPYIN